MRDPGRSGERARIPERPGVAGGLGLAIVEELAMRWGSDRDPEGYEVWADVAVCADESSAAEL